jgi:hypothetical protein
MKLITINQLKFAGSLFLLTIAFRYGLSSLLETSYFTLVWVLAAGYAIAIFAVAWNFGKKDYEYLPLFDIGFRFHLTTYVVCNLIAEIWFLIGFQSKHENIQAVHITAIAWGIGLLIHFVFYLFARKNAIKGIDKSEIFE